jgi:cytochrome c biogenesis protein CcmG/thiol:disulfide interchange protein DsbE
MKIKTSFFFFFLCVVSISYAQKKQLWAKSFIDTQAPELNIKQWVSQQPNTEGKFILIDFWGTWCGPCVKGIPDMNEYQKEFKDQLVVIGISMEPIEKVRAFKKAKMEYSSGIDTNGALNKAYEIQGIPHVVLIDPKGIVRWEGFPFMGGHELTSKVIEDLIAKYK